MPSSLCFTIRFLQPYSHARGDRGEPEWPPSPLRLFQALAAAAAGYWNERMRLAYAVPALEWLERQPSPEVIAAPATPASTRRRHYVPDNVGDKVGKSWSRGGSEDIASFRTEKDVWPANLQGEAINYLFTIRDDDPEFHQHKETLATAARAVTHLGWGIDHVVGHAALLSKEEAARLPGDRWLPGEELGEELRTPTHGTLVDLMAKHQAFLSRLQRDARGNESFLPVPPLSAFRVTSYRKATESDLCPYAAFQILKPELVGNRSFDTPRRVRDVAAWLRHAVGQVCDGWPFESQDPVEAFVHGHDGQSKPIKGQRAERRFMFLPLPSIERRGERGNYVGAIRRVLLVAPPGCERQLDYARKRLAGFELVDMEGEIRGVLNLLSKSDWVLRQYTQPATSWSTVTPVVLPGHDDRDPDKAAELIARAFRQAGFAPELLRATQIDFRKVGFLPGVDHADRYELPEQPKVKGPRYHVQVRFPHALPGPIAVGALRYRGFGLMVA